MKVIIANMHSAEGVIMAALLRHSTIFDKKDIRWMDSRHLRGVPVMEDVTDYYWCDCVPGDSAKSDLFANKDVVHHYLEDERITHMPATPLSLVACDISDTLTEIGQRRIMAMIDTFVLMRKGGNPSLVSLAHIMTNQTAALRSLMMSDIKYIMSPVPSTKDHATLKKIPQAEYYKLPEIENFLAHTAKNKRNLASNLRIVKFYNKEAAIMPVTMEDAVWTEKLMKQRFNMGLLYDFTMDRLYIRTWGMTQKETSDVLLSLKKFYGVLDSVVEIGVA